MKSYDDVVRKSIRKDFRNANFARNGRVPKSPHPANTKRVIFLTPDSSYSKYMKLIVGKLVRIVSSGLSGNWCEFVNDEDRQALNNAAGYSNSKTTYLFDGAKFD